VVVWTVFWTGTVVLVLVPEVVTAMVAEEAAVVVVVLDLMWEKWC